MSIEERLEEIKVQNDVNKFLNKRNAMKLAELNNQLKSAPGMLKSVVEDAIRVTESEKKTAEVVDRVIGVVREMIKPEGDDV